MQGEASPALSVFLLAATLNDLSVPCNRKVGSGRYRWQDLVHAFSAARRLTYVTESTCQSGRSFILMRPSDVTML